MTKQFYKKIIIYLCVVAIIFSFVQPCELLALDGNSQIFDVVAYDLWTNEQYDIELLEFMDSYYINNNSLTNLSSDEFVSSDYDGEIIQFNNEQWYQLNESLNQVRVFILIDESGRLFFHSVSHNEDSIKKEIDLAFSEHYFDADILKDMGAMETAAIVVANIYDIVTNFRINALWGEAYKEDLKSCILNILLPYESDNAFTTIKSLNSRMNNMSKALLKAESAYENAIEFLYDIPAGGEILLFGIEGSQYIRESLEGIQAINHADFLNEFIKSRLISSGLKPYADAFEGLDKTYNVSLKAYGIKDLLNTGEYIVDLVNVSMDNANALNHLINANMSTANFPLKGNQVYIKNISADLLTDYYAICEKNVRSGLLNFCQETLKTVSSNLTENAFKTAVLGEFSLFTTLAIYSIEKLSDVDEETQAVWNMYLCSNLQDYFKTFYAQNPNDIQLCKDAALLYLRCAWTSYDSFAFTEGIGASIDILKGRIEELATTISSYPAEMFVQIMNETDWPPMLFKNYREISLSQIPSIDDDILFSEWNGLLMDTSFEDCVSESWGETNMLDYIIRSSLCYPYSRSMRRENDIEICEFSDDEYIDPRHWFEWGYDAIPSDVVDFIFIHVFNQPQDQIQRMRDLGEKTCWLSTEHSEGFYFYDGKYYYGYFPSGYPELDIEYQSIFTDGKNYYVWYQLVIWPDDPAYEDWYAVLSLENEDGLKYWRINVLTSNPPEVGNCSL